MHQIGQLATAVHEIGHALGLTRATDASCPTDVRDDWPILHQVFQDLSDCTFNVPTDEVCFQ